jgi:hypothetical protein
MTGASYLIIDVLWIATFGCVGRNENNLAWTLPQDAAGRWNLRRRANSTWRARHFGASTLTQYRMEQGNTACVR